MIALIDGDLIAFINAASAENDPPEIALIRADKHVRNILDYLDCTSYKLFLSGGTNFRYEVNPNYKANRTAPSPIHRKLCHQFLIDEWKAEETDGYEADDALGCFQREDSIICSLDKDLLMIPGKHYSWPITRQGKVLRDHKVQEVTYEQGIRHFYEQSLIGDTADNIFGVVGLGPVKAKKALEGCVTEKEMYTKVLDLYQQESIDKAFHTGITEDDIQRVTFEAYERLVMNLDCLWIWRHLGITWSIRSENLTDGNN